MLSTQSGASLKGPSKKLKCPLFGGSAVRGSQCMFRCTYIGKIALTIVQIALGFVHSCLLWATYIGLYM